MSLCVSFKVDVRCFGGLNVFELNGDEDMFCFIPASAMASSLWRSSSIQVLKS